MHAVLSQVLCRTGNIFCAQYLQLLMVLYFDWWPWEENSIFIFFPCFLCIWFFPAALFTSIPIVLDFSSSPLSCKEGCVPCLSSSAEIFAVRLWQVSSACTSLQQWVCLPVVIGASRCSLLTFCSLWNFTVSTCSTKISSQVCVISKTLVIIRWTTSVRGDPGPLVFFHVFGCHSQCVLHLFQ